MGYVVGSAIVIKTAVTFDGGKTWSSTANTPHVVAGYGSADPSLAFDGSGNVYLCFIDFNTAADAGAVYVSKSTDGGLSWAAPVEVINAQSDGSQRPLDRPWMAIDRSGGTYDGTIYITTMSPNVFGPLPPPFHPYLTRSTDGGLSFGAWKYLDSTGWLAGSDIQQPMPSLTVGINGVFHAVYPSWVVSQNVYPQYISASSNDGGLSFNYSSIVELTQAFDDSLAKKAYLLRSDPADSSHLVFLYIGVEFGDGDVLLRESFNSGSTWSNSVRVNDDPIGNNRLQDMVWADFDDDGDLVVTWRDRRNGTNSTYMTSTEMWGAVRWKDSTSFSSNFKLSDESVAYDTVLAGSGNDFMCVNFIDDTLNAVWGDTRNGRLNIWFQRTGPDGMVVSIKKLASESAPQVKVFPNPHSMNFTVEAEKLRKVVVYNQRGQVISTYADLKNTRAIIIDLSSEAQGTYTIQVTTSNGVSSRKIIRLK